MDQFGKHGADGQVMNVNALHIKQNRRTLFEYKISNNQEMTYQKVSHFFSKPSTLANKCKYHDYSMDVPLCGIQAVTAIYQYSLMRIHVWVLWENSIGTKPLRW